MGQSWAREPGGFQHGFTFIPRSLLPLLCIPRWLRAPLQLGAAWVMLGSGALPAAQREEPAPGGELWARPTHAGLLPCALPTILTNLTPLGRSLPPASLRSLSLCSFRKEQNWGPLQARVSASAKLAVPK